MGTAFRLLGLVVVHYVARFVIAGPIAMESVTAPMFEVMVANPEVFADFSGEDAQFLWTTSYLYNFVIWLAPAWMFHLARPALAGNDVVRSLKLYGLAWLFFAAINAALMNHYTHPKEFYVASILDGAVAFAVVGLTNGLVYRRIMGAHANGGR